MHLLTPFLLSFPMSSVGRTTRNRRRPTGLVNSRVRWNIPERDLLIEAKDQHSDLDWNHFRDLGLFPDRSARSLQWTYERATEARARRRNGSNASKRPTPPSSLDERQQKKLRRGEEEDDAYEETSSEEEASDESEESSSESGSDNDESENKNVGATANRPDGMQSSEKPYPWNITASTPSGSFRISAAAGSLTDIGGPSGSVTTRRRAHRQGNSSPSGKKACETGLAGQSRTPASQTLLQAAHALQQHESNLNLLEARHESQNSYLKEELDRLRQEIAGMKRRNTHLEKIVEDLKSS
ncbi:hypothetical protein BJX66DRAFT_292960 [Aspergillus keveii]|uniref:Uncharacterized protein n=1 Tax=Aspergillus keveii TaxID=714993 RepID=A0ABR4GK72_9EURO